MRICGWASSVCVRVRACMGVRVRVCVRDRDGEESVTKQYVIVAVGFTESVCIFL